MAGKGGGAWKVAYADFVTAMMAFFMVMWITAQSQEAKESVVEHFNAPLFGWTEARGTHTPQMVNDLQRKSIATSRPPEAVLDGMRAAKRRFEDVSTSVHFADGSSELDANAQKSLERLVPHLAGKLQRIEIRGHNTRQPAGQASKDRAPWDICYARCLATLAFLEDRGIAPDRIRISLAGSNEPRADQADLPTTNSRVEVLLLSEFVRTTGDKPQ